MRTSLWTYQVPHLAAACITWHAQLAPEHAFALAGESAADGTDAQPSQGAAGPLLQGVLPDLQMLTQPALVFSAQLPEHQSAVAAGEETQLPGDEDEDYDPPGPPLLDSEPQLEGGPRDEAEAELDMWLADQVSGSRPANLQACLGWL